MLLGLVVLGGLGARSGCDALLPPRRLEEVQRAIHDSPVALFGWKGCPCTGIALTRFASVGLCFAQNTWAEYDDELMRYFQCAYGDQHHSFIFAGGDFVGDGFRFAENRMSAERLDAMLRGASARLTCDRTGFDMSLAETPLKSCTQANDGTTTGWTRTGSCAWSPSDGGYHEVCVTMSDEFLRTSAAHDANDLSRVVHPGGHWCICAWAFASAVSRDPHGLEGIELDCGRTNRHLRAVYQAYIDAHQDLTSPSGARYKAQAALDRVNELCPPAEGGSSGMAADGAPALVASAARADPAATLPRVAGVAALLLVVVGVLAVAANAVYRDQGRADLRQHRTVLNDQTPTPPMD